MLEEIRSSLETNSLAANVFQIHPDVCHHDLDGSVMIDAEVHVQLSIPTGIDANSPDSRAQEKLEFLYQSSLVKAMSEFDKVLYERLTDGCHDHLLDEFEGLAGDDGVAIIGSDLIGATLPTLIDQWEPAPSYELLKTGSLGTYANTKIRTDGFRYENLKFMPHGTIMLMPEKSVYGVVSFTTNEIVKVRSEDPDSEAFMFTITMKANGEVSDVHRFEGTPDSIQ